MFSLSHTPETLEKLNANSVFITHWFIANLRVGKLIHMLWFFYICLQCMGVINLGGEVGCMISEGPWLFVGIPNFVKVRWEANLDFLSSIMVQCYCSLFLLSSIIMQCYYNIIVQHYSYVKRIRLCDLILE